MPQRSLTYAVSRIRVLEGRLLTADQLERVRQAADLPAALKAVQEAGVSGGRELLTAEALESALTSWEEAAARVVAEVSPDTAATDTVLLPIDYHNLKVFVKARYLQTDASSLVLRGGTIDPARLASAVHDNRYGGLPEAMKDALAALDKRLSVDPSPQAIDILLDQAMAADLAARAASSRNDTVRAYVRDHIDLSNLLAALRLRDDALFEAAFLPGGSLPAQSFRRIYESPEAARALFEGRADIREALKTYAAGHGLTHLERAAQDPQLSLFARKRARNDSIEAIVGYLLARRAEAAKLRLLVLQKMDNLPEDAVRARERMNYAG